MVVPVQLVRSRQYRIAAAILPGSDSRRMRIPMGGDLRPFAPSFIRRVPVLHSTSSMGWRAPGALAFDRFLER